MESFLHYYTREIDPVTLGMQKKNLDNEFNTLWFVFMENRIPHDLLKENRSLPKVISVLSVHGW